MEHRSDADDDVSTPAAAAAAASSEETAGPTPLPRSATDASRDFRGGVTPSGRGDLSRLVSPASRTMPTPGGGRWAPSRSSLGGGEGGEGGGVGGSGGSGSEGGDGRGSGSRSCPSPTTTEAAEAAHGTPPQVAALYRALLARRDSGKRPQAGGGGGGGGGDRGGGADPDKWLAEWRARSEAAQQLAPSAGGGGGGGGGGGRGAGTAGTACGPVGEGIASGVPPRMRRASGWGGGGGSGGSTAFGAPAAGEMTMAEELQSAQAQLQRQGEMLARDFEFVLAQLDARLTSKKRELMGAQAAMRELQKSLDARARRLDERDATLRLLLGGGAGHLGADAAREAFADAWRKLGPPPTPGGAGGAGGVGRT